MNKTVDHYISELLFLHDCIILPEFGGFVGNPQSAKLNKITGILSPPSKQILFNSNLNNDPANLVINGTGDILLEAPPLTNETQMLGGR